MNGFAWEEPALRGNNSIRMYLNTFAKLGSTEASGEGVSWVGRRCEGMADEEDIGARFTRDKVARGEEAFVGIIVPVVIVGMDIVLCFGDLALAREDMVGNFGDKGVGPLVGFWTPVEGGEAEGGGGVEEHV